MLKRAVETTRLDVEAIPKGALESLARWLYDAMIKEKREEVQDGERPQVCALPE